MATIRAIEFFLQSIDRFALPMFLPAISSLLPDSLASTDPTWVVCLCADWCGVCREYRVIFESVAAQHSQLRFAWLDVEDQAGLVGDLDIETFPTLLVADAHGACFMGALTPHAHTLSRLLEALGDPAAERRTVNTLLDIPALLLSLQASPALWVKNQLPG